MLFFLVPCAPSHVIRVCFHDQTKNIRVSCLFVLFYDWYILLSVMFSVFSTPSCIHALFHILNSLEAQISIYLLLTVGQKHLKTPLFCLQISIPDFRVSYFSLHCVADKPNRVSHFSAQIFPSALLMYFFFFFDYLCLNKILWPITSCSSQTLSCQSKHYTQLSGIIINTYPAVVLLFVMSNLKTQHSET